MCNLDTTDLSVVDDIEVDEYNFTDGCGNMSSELADYCAGKFGYSQTSAVQVRIAGVKGVLMVKPSLRGRSVELRPSMIKFDMKNDTALNVIRCATASRAKLNRQLILCLSSLGVPDSYFVKRLDEAIKSANFSHVID